jgi:hypothetical protein
MHGYFELIPGSETALQVLEFSFFEPQMSATSAQLRWYIVIQRQQGKIPEKREEKCSYSQS